MNAPITITREDLYERIWKLPATKLAKELGISDVALAKICRKLNVPKPGLGHWRLVQLGRKTKRAPLPPLEAQVRATATIDPEPHRTQRTPGGPDPAKKPEYEVIPVAESLHGANPLISRTKRLLEAEKPESNGLVQAPWKLRVLNVEVSRAQTNRALRIMDALLKALERRGATFVKSKERDMEYLRIGEETIGFELTELVDKSEKEPENEDQRKSSSWEWQKWKFQPTGRLVFRILASEPKGARRSWSDCTKHNLEEKLGEIVEWLFITADGVKKARLKWEEQQRKWAEERRRREEIEWRRRQEEEHRATLVSQSQQWLIACNLRSFIAACEKELMGNKAKFSANGWEPVWLAWARNYADQIDPVSHGFLEQERKRFRGSEEQEE